ncbi:conserved hypothetical protein [Leptospira interrogans serovar Manilae]|uniref:Uncharacterized protein n=3 Tax=Leptospira interrogans TaxID=173 RepID=A0AAQ1SM18_LEPIR|nr:hypothetical protein [Leptospira interrogans]ALE38303.1 hypothetical protein G436_1095 [Leptospira interrogans serovar Hardjo str. Norma]EKO96936.1 hypothetical protein LEP1GSC057_3688 [Leptospira interrogans str. Brem 329]EKR17708.1 hypothetical protein LEP1GSC019_4378 [Leptospira interrogans serovar Pyrogenes str. 2006006960]EMF42760.1 hypothetical protein LEP1GSC067_4286 [Leptospira interrogans serovar Lora str. TE 1992]EMJ53356.1 hypothetical protein LEP1GSC013_0700 [Leptospira interrog
MSLKNFEKIKLKELNEILFTKAFQVMSAFVMKFASDLLKQYLH